MAPSSFPLVGRKYRFKRVLTDATAPWIRVTYASVTALNFVKLLALLLAAALVFICARRGARWWHIALATLGLVALLVLAHYVIGVHRRIVWGAVLGVVLALWTVRHQRPRRGVWLGVLAEPWRVLDLVTPRNALDRLGPGGV